MQPEEINGFLFKKLEDEQFSECFELFKVFLQGKMVSTSKNLHAFVNESEDKMPAAQKIKKLSGIKFRVYLFAITKLKLFLRSL